MSETEADQVEKKVREVSIDPVTVDALGKMVDKAYDRLTTAGWMPPHTVQRRFNGGGPLHRPPETIGIADPPSVNPPLSVADRLAALGSLNRERGKVYGDDYKHIGDMLMAVFPRGLTLSTPEEFRRFSMFNLMAVKLARYGQNMKRGGHADSLDDVAVYSQMLRETDEEAAGEEEKTTSQDGKAG